MSAPAVICMKNDIITFLTTRATIIIVHTSMVWDDVQSKTGIVLDAMDERLTFLFLS